MSKDKNVSTHVIGPIFYRHTETAYYDAFYTVSYILGYRRICRFQFKTRGEQSFRDDKIAALKSCDRAEASTEIRNAVRACLASLKYVPPSVQTPTDEKDYCLHCHRKAVFERMALICPGCRRVLGGV